LQETLAVSFLSAMLFDCTVSVIRLFFFVAGVIRGSVALLIFVLRPDFLTIHPFMDANGRVARSITDQAARELLNEGYRSRVC